MLNKNKSLLVIVLLSLIGLAAFFFYPLKSSKESPWVVENVQPFKWWYQINWQNQAVGWASLELKEVDDFYIIIEEDFITGRVQSERMEFQFKRWLKFENADGYNLHSAIIESKEPSLSVNKLLLNDAPLVVTETRNGKEVTKNYPKVEYSLSDYLSKYSWAFDNKNKSVLIAKELNNDDYGLHYSRYQIIGKEASFTVKHQLQNTAALDDAYQSQASTLMFDKFGQLIHQRKANGMEYLWSEGKVSINPEMQRDLYLSSGIKVNQPLGMVNNIQTLSLGLSQDTAESFSSHPAIKIADDQLFLRSGYQYKPLKLPKVEVAHPRAKAIAEMLIIGLDTNEAKIKKLLNYVNKELNYQTLPASFEINDILDNKIGDCTEHALLLTEMLNAINIPARQVSGLIYLGDDKLQFGGHVWVEVYLNGVWQAVDPTWNLFQVTATHIPLIVGANKTPKILQNSSQLTFTVNNIEYY